MPTQKDLPLCPIGVIVHLLGGKWKLLIIRNLLQRPWYFNELKRGVAGISHKMLASSLRELETHKLVRRDVMATPRKSVRYSLTDLGETLRPLFAAMKDWGKFYKKPWDMGATRPRLHAGRKVPPRHATPGNDRGSFRGRAGANRAVSLAGKSWRRRPH